MLTKQIKLKHGISELGNLQVYRVTEIIEDGKIISSTMEQPYTPADVNNMVDFDNKSKDIVEAIIDQEVKDAFEAEKQEVIGVGIEKIISYDRTIDNLERISIRQITRIFDNGKELSKKYHRSWIMPGDNPEGNDVMSRAVARKLHTPEVRAAFKEKMAVIK